jgi:hypothetical protein
MFRSALKPAGSKTDLSHHHIPKPTPECRSRALLVIFSDTVMCVDPFERREHLSIPSRDSSCPDKRFEVLDLKL